MLRRMPAIAIASVTLAVLGCGGSRTSDQERARAVRAAHRAYEEAVEAGRQLGTGPCIAERLPGLPDWVVDIAHRPRQAIDDGPANQCRRYRDGTAAHFVELDPKGDVIRTG